MSGFTLAMPGTAGEAWAVEVEERFHLSVRSLCRALDAPMPEITITQEAEEATLRVGDDVLHLRPEGLGTDALSRQLDTLAALHAWPAILAPALAARGVATRWWLRHAARRGLTLDDLAQLGEGDASDEAIAWQLADRFPPVLSLRAGERAATAFADAGLRDGAAQQAALWCGLPVPKPPAPQRDSALGPDEAALALGVLPMPAFASFGRGDLNTPLATALLQAVPALVDPALALALITDEARVSRRHAAAALARSGAVTIARRIAEQVDYGTVDLAAIVDAAAGIAPP